jgi:Glycosyl transferase family 90
MWKSLLKKRADTDLSMYSDFSVPKLSKQDRQKVVLIEITKGKYNVLDKASYKDSPYKDMITNRISVIEYYLKKLDLSDISCVLAFYVWDSYGEEFSFPHFSWAKPHNKKGLLFPCWTFKNWDEVINEAETSLVPWKDKKTDAYFKGSGKTTPRSKIRQTMQKIFPDYVKLDGAHEPWTEMFKHKILFDIPGHKPWSLRSPLIALSGSVPMRILQYYPKWNEDVWIQFYEDPEEIRDGAIEIKANYDKEFIPSKEFEEVCHQTLEGSLRKWKRAQRIQKRMMELKEEDIVFYLEYLIKQFAEKQNKN